MGKGGQSSTGGGTDAAAAENGPPVNWQGIGQAITGAFQQAPTAFPQSSGGGPGFAALNMAPPATGNQSSLERRLLFMKMLAQREV